MTKDTDTFPRKPTNPPSVRVINVLLLCLFFLAHGNVVAGDGDELEAQVADDDLLLFKSVKMKKFSERFMLPSSYSDDRIARERDKLERYFSLLLESVGDINASHKKERCERIYPLSINGGDKAGWEENENVSKTACIQYETTFSKIGVLTSEFRYAQVNGKWFIESFSIGDDDNTSEKTKRLNAIGVNVIGRVVGFH